MDEVSSKLKKLFRKKPKGFKGSGHKLGSTSQALCSCRVVLATMLDDLYAALQQVEQTVSCAARISLHKLRPGQTFSTISASSASAAIIT